MNMNMNIKYSVIIDSLFMFITINSISIYVSVSRYHTLVNTLNWYTNLGDTIRDPTIEH